MGCGVSSSDSPTAPSRFSARVPRTRSPRSAGCSTSASPEPVSGWDCRGPWRAARSNVAPAAEPFPRRSSPGCSRKHPSAKRKSRPQADDAELFGRLRAWRKRQAEALSVPAYVVFSDATLVAISDSRPSDRSELARVSGIGPSKLDRYGEPLLAVLSGADPEAVNLVIDTG